MAKSKKTTAVKKGLSKPKSLMDKTSKAAGVSLGSDKDGYFVYTHRARSKSYKNVASISKKVIEDIESTG